MLAKELKEKILGKERANDFHVNAFTENDKSWWHVHNDEEVPDKWFLRPFPDGDKYIN